MIKNSSDNMQHDNKISNNVVRLESITSSLAPFDNNINTVLITMNPYFEATNQEFQDIEQHGPHPTKNAAFSSSFSSLYTPQICHDLFPMICCSLLHYSSLNLRLISTL